MKFLSSAVIAAMISYAPMAGASEYFEFSEPNQQQVTKDGKQTASGIILDSVSVTGSRVQMTLGKSARIVTVIDSSSIAALPVQSVNDLLKYAAGVDVRQRGEMGAQTDISVRGGTFDQIAIFLNGINICDPQTGHNAVDLPVDINEIERIEVLSGPAGVAYGSSSLLGAINIITKEVSGPALGAHLEGGSYGYLNAGVRGGHSNGRLSNQLSAGYMRSDGSSRSSDGRLNADYQTYKVFYNGKYIHELADVKWSAGMTSRDFGSNTFYSAKFDNQFEHTLKTFFSLQAETRGKLRFSPKVYWNRMQDRFELVRGDSGKVPFNYNRTSVWGASVDGYVETVIGKTAFGVEMRNEDLISTNLGDPLSVPKPIHKADTSYGKGLNRTNISIFLEHSVLWRNLSASAGVAAVKNTGNEDDFKFYPGVNLSYRFAGDWKAYASYNSSLRMPTFTELFYSVGGHKADRNLKAEKMQALEGGIRFSKPWISAVATVYYNMGSDMIDWVKNLSEGEDAPWRSVNYTKINTFGQEFSLRMDIPSLLMRKSFFVRTIDLSYSHISQNKDLGADKQSKYALEYLRHKAVAHVGFNIWKSLGADLSWRWQDRVGNYERYDKLAPTGQMVSYKPYSLVDLRFAWTRKIYSVYLEANNLLDHTYYDYGNIPQPGITVKAGIVVNMRL